MAENPTITIGIPSLEMSHTLFQKCFLAMQKPECTIYIPERIVVHYARNMIVDQVLNTYKTDYLFFLDSDMVFNEDILMQLLKHRDKDIVGALAFKRVEPYSPCIMNKRDDGYHFIAKYPQDLFEVDAIGMAGTLIKRKVLEKMVKPYFHFDNGLGEDINFCKEAKDRGFKVWVDTRIKMGHIAQTVIEEKHYLENAQKEIDKKESKFKI